MHRMPNATTYGHWVVIFLLCVNFAQVRSQNRTCATHKLNQTDKIGNKQAPSTSIVDAHKRSAALANSSSIVTIPVVVHVIQNDLYPSSNPTNAYYVTDEQIFSQIKILNDDFRRMANTKGYNNHPLGVDVGIEFCLASTAPNGYPTTGINRVQHSKSMWTLSDERELKGLSYWPSDQYLNIWVANIDLTEGLGYARYPSGTPLGGLDNFDYGEDVDGVVISYRTFGNKGTATHPYNLGRTATHEIGHWLGLIHIWGDAACGDDFVDDTPVDAGPNQDLDCSDVSNCFGEEISDMTNNYLDFSPDACMNLFTIGQKERMLTALRTSPRRLGLAQSKGCLGVHNSPLNIRVFPSPAFRELNLELYGPGYKMVELDWYSSQGIFLYRQQIEYRYQTLAMLDVSNLEPGLYFLLANDGSNKKRFKILISQ
jgi:hypothetical protein